MALKSQTILSKFVRRLDTDLKRWLAGSAAVHIVIFLVIIIIPSLTAKRYYFGPVQPVNLTMGAVAPGGGGKEAGAKAVKKDGTKSPKTAKAKTRKVLPLQTPPKDTYSKKSAEKQKPKAKTKSLKERLNEKLEAVEKEGPKEKEPEWKEFGEEETSSKGTSLKLSSGSGSMTAGFGGPGGENLPFAWYLDVIQTKITENWEEPSGLIIPDNTLSVTVFFRIDRSGKVLELYIKTPSNRKDVDDTVIEAVKKSEPLPPLPEEFKGDFLDINIKFDLNK